MKHLLRHIGIVLAFFTVTVATAVALVRVFAPNDACVGNAKLLYQAVTRYEQDHYGHLPPTQSVQAFQSSLKNYVTDTKVFTCPATGKAYIPNPNPTGAPDKTYLFKDAVPHSDGYPTIVYLDGHVERNGVEPGDTNEICASRVKQLAIGVYQYAQDYDEILPKMNSSTELKQSISPYVNVQRYFICPATNKSYLPNPSLSSKSYAQIYNPESLYLIIDAQAHNDGIKTTIYFDGHINRTITANHYTCQFDEKRIALALYQYIQDNDERFPLMTNQQTINSELTPYTKTKDLNCPETGLPYQWNTKLSGVFSSSITDDTTTEVLRDAKIHDDGSLNVLYFDGRVTQYFTPWFIPHQVAVTSADHTDNMYLVWKKPDGTTQIWLLDSYGLPISTRPLNSSITSADNIFVDPYRTLWGYTQSNNAVSVWSQSITGAVNQYNFGPYDGWTASGIGVGNNHIIRMLWTRYDNTAAVWFATADGRYQSDQRIPVPTGMKAIGFNVCPDGRCIVLWGSSSGSMVLSKMESSGAIYTSHAYSFTGWKPVAITSDPSNRSYVLWSDNNGNASLWAMYADWTYKQTTYSMAPGWNAVSLAVGSDGNRRIVWHNDDGRSRLVVYNQKGAQISMHEYPAMR